MSKFDTLQPDPTAIGEVALDDPPVVLVALANHEPLPLDPLDERGGRLEGAVAGAGDAAHRDRALVAQVHQEAQLAHGQLRRLQSGRRIMRLEHPEVRVDDLIGDGPGRGHHFDHAWIVHVNSKC